MKIIWYRNAVRKYMGCGWLCWSNLIEPRTEAAVGQPLQWLGETGFVIAGCKGTEGQCF